MGASTEERLTALETEFRTVLRHLAAKADLTAAIAGLERRMIGFMLVLFSVSGGAVVTAIKSL